MTDPVATATFTPIEGTDPALPGDPFSRPRYMYGQLLGAEDFTSEQNYHLLRARLRNALLHGSGVACGLDLVATATVTPPTAELRCTPGLAIDPLGREIYVPKTVCLDVTGLSNNASFWSDLKAPPNAPAGSKARRTYAVLTYRACLADQVPAIAPPCSDADQSIAYSRVLDSYRLCLEATPPVDPNPLSRDWLAAGSQALPDPAGLRARLQALLTGKPADLSALWTQAEEAKVLLAVVDLEPVGDASNTTKVNLVDTSVRALVPDVQTIAQFSMGTRLIGPADPPPFALMSATIAAGTEADAGRMVLTASLSAKILAGTVTANSTRLFKLVAGAWTAPPVEAASVADTSVTVKIDEAWAVETTWQLVLSGGNAMPILDMNNQPLAGLVGDPVPLPGRGRDACIVGTFKP